MAKAHRRKSRQWLLRLCGPLRREILAQREEQLLHLGLNGGNRRTALELYLRGYIMHGVIAAELSLASNMRTHIHLCAMHKFRLTPQSLVLAAGQLPEGIGIGIVKARHAAQ